MVGYLAIAGNLRAIAKDAPIAHFCVVGDMGTLHEHIIVADDRLPASMRGTVDDDILTDDIVIANDALRFLATELEVLRQCADNSTLMHLVTCSHACAVENGHEGEDDASVTNLYIALDIYEGEYLTIVTDLGSGVNFGLRGYFACHNYQLSNYNYFPPPPNAV